MVSFSEEICCDTTLLVTVRVHVLLPQVARVQSLTPRCILRVALSGSRTTDPRRCRPPQLQAPNQEVQEGKSPLSSQLRFFFCVTYHMPFENNFRGSFSHRHHLIDTAYCKPLCISLILGSKRYPFIQSSVALWSNHKCFKGSL